MMLRLRSHKLTLHSCWGLSGSGLVSRDILSKCLLVTLIAGQRPSREDHRAGGIFSGSEWWLFTEHLLRAGAGNAAQCPQQAGAKATACPKWTS